MIGICETKFTEYYDYQFQRIYCRGILKCAQLMYSAQNLKAAEEMSMAGVTQLELWFRMLAPHAPRKEIIDCLKILCLQYLMIAHISLLLDKFDQFHDAWDQVDFIQRNFIPNTDGFSQFSRHSFGNFDFHYVDLLMAEKEIEMIIKDHYHTEYFLLQQAKEDYEKLHPKLIQRPLLPGEILVKHSHTINDLLPDIQGAVEETTQPLSITSPRSRRSNKLKKSVQANSSNQRHFTKCSSSQSLHAAPYEQATRFQSTQGSRKMISSLNNSRVSMKHRKSINTKSSEDLRAQRSKYDKEGEVSLDDILTGLLPTTQTDLPMPSTKIESSSIAVNRQHNSNHPSSQAKKPSQPSLHKHLNLFLNHQRKGYLCNSNSAAALKDNPSQPLPTATTKGSIVAVGKMKKCKEKEVCHGVVDVGNHFEGDINGRVPEIANLIPDKDTLARLEKEYKQEHKFWYHNFKTKNSYNGSDIVQAKKHEVEQLLLDERNDFRFAVKTFEHRMIRGLSEEPVKNEDKSSIDTKSNVIKVRRPSIDGGVSTSQTSSKPRLLRIISRNQAKLKMKRFLNTKSLSVEAQNEAETLMLKRLRTVADRVKEKTDKVDMQNRSLLARQTIVQGMDTCTLRGAKLTEYLEPSISKQKKKTADYEDSWLPEKVIIETRKRRNNEENSLERSALNSTKAKNISFSTKDATGLNPASHSEGNTKPYDDKSKDIELKRLHHDMNVLAESTNLASSVKGVFGAKVKIATLLKITQSFISAGEEHQVRKRAEREFMASIATIAHNS